jgi:hypothetical protein
LPQALKAFWRPQPRRVRQLPYLEHFADEPKLFLEELKALQQLGIRYSGHGGSFDMHPLTIRDATNDLKGRRTDSGGRQPLSIGDLIDFSNTGTAPSKFTKYRCSHP